MKRAVIATGGKQYIVSEGDDIEVELIGGGKTTEFQPLLIIDEQKVYVGQPLVDKAKVAADVIKSDVQTDKVVAIRYKAKKRVKKVRGHRQHKSLLKIKSISSPAKPASSK